MANDWTVVKETPAPAVATQTLAQPSTLPTGPTAPSAPTSGVAPTGGASPWQVVSETPADPNAPTQAASLSDASQNVPYGPPKPVRKANLGPRDTSVAQMSPEDRAARNAKLDSYAKAGLSVAGAMIAPELLPALGTGGGLAAAAERVGVRATATALGGALGHTAGQVVTNQPIDTQESAKAGVSMGLLDTLFGIGGESVSGAAKYLQKSQFTQDVLQRIKDFSANLAGKVPYSSSNFTDTLEGMILSTKKAVGAAFGKAQNAAFEKVEGIPVAPKDIDALAEKAHQLLSESHFIPKDEGSSLSKDAQDLVEKMTQVAKGTKTGSEEPITAEWLHKSGKEIYDLVDAGGLNGNQAGAAKSFAKLITNKVYSSIADVSPELAADYKTASNNFFNFNDTVRDSVLKSLLNKDPFTGDLQLRPTITKAGEYLWGKASPESVAAIKNLVGEENFPTVQQGALHYMWNEVFNNINKAGGLSEAEQVKAAAGTLRNVWNEPGVEGQKAFFGPQQAEMNQYVTDLTKSLQSGVLKKVGSHIILAPFGKLRVLVSPSVMADLSNSNAGRAAVRGFIGAVEPNAAKTALRNLVKMISFGAVDSYYNPTPDPDAPKPVIGQLKPQASMHIIQDSEGHVHALPPEAMELAQQEDPGLKLLRKAG